MTYASQLVPELRRLGHKVFMLTADKAPEHNDPDTIDLRDFASSQSLWNRVMSKIDPGYAAVTRASSPIVSAIKELIEKHSLDVFEIEEFAGLSFAVSRLRLLPVVVRLHGPWFMTGRFNDAGIDASVNHGRQEREGKGIRSAQLISAPSERMLQAVKERYELDRTATRVIPNPFQAVSAAETWNSTDCDNASLLFVGRFDSLKGGDLVLYAFAELAIMYPQLTLTFIGNNLGIREPGGTPLYFEDFFSRTFPQSLRSRVNFCGPMDHENVMSQRRKHFVTIIASQQEMMPYSVLEAMSVSCPLVATAVGGIPELIQDMRNGLLVWSHEPKELAVACRKLIEDRSLAARLGRQAWEDCRDRYAPDKIAKQTIAAYESAIDKFNLRSRRAYRKK